MLISLWLRQLSGQESQSSLDTNVWISIFMDERLRDEFSIQSGCRVYVSEETTGLKYRKFYSIRKTAMLTFYGRGTV